MRYLKIILKNIKNTLFVLLISLLSFCSDSEKKKFDLIYSLQKSSKLATTEILLSKLLFARKENNLLFIPIGNAQFAANTYAHVKYGIDFSKIKSKDINIIGEGIEITLPHFEIISFSYPSETLDLIDEYTDNSLFTKITYEEVDEIYRQAETQLWIKARQIEINKILKENTSNVLKVFLGSLGYNKIIIHYSDQLN